MIFDLNILLRNNIHNLTPYSSARDEYKESEGIFLDANENSLGSPIDDIVENVNRYPDPLQVELKSRISQIKGVPAENIFIGNGSDEAIDILIRAFCNPGRDKIVICPPTYGMYEVSAAINDAGVVKVNLTPDTFQLQPDKIIQLFDPTVKLVFFNSPNNPTGNSLKWDDMKQVLDHFSGIVVIDEAYINFALRTSLIPELLNYPNLIILQTFSKAWGLAGLRVGLAFASKPIIEIFNKIKPPYNINVVSQQLVMEAIENIEQVNNFIKELVEERKTLSEALLKCPFIKKVYPSESNFILVKVERAKHLYDFLISRQVVVRDRSKASLCEDCLRITVGKKNENEELLKLLSEYEYI